MHGDAMHVLELELLQADANARTQNGRPFSLVFRGPREPVMVQRIYRLDNDKLGSFELFLVPIGPDDHGMRYEAVFT
ncbi:MAG: hypothetical protein J2P17_03600 [Mycobacterium sp.]|nr:hypothetical protein [Mycobacterium sp.]